MGREVVCPRCGLHLSVDEVHGVDADLPFSSRRTTEVLLPLTHSVADLGLGPILDAVDPDPILGPIGVRSAADPVPNGSSGDHLPVVESSALSSSAVVVLESTDHVPGWAAASQPAVPELAAGAGSWFFNAPEAEVLPPAVPAPDALAGLNFDRPAVAPVGVGPAGEVPASEPLEATPIGTVSPSAPVENEAGDGGLSWVTVLLGSYASAMTLAVVYLVWFVPRGPVEPPTVPTDSRPDLGSQVRVASEPIPVERRTSLGKTLRVGDLEVTPLEIRDESITLRKAGSRGTEAGEAGTLVLHLRLRNTSSGESFAPLDRAFVREPDRGLPESYIEQADGSIIDIYPLAIESERSIDGQSFDVLPPGDQRETIVVSDSDASTRVDGPMTWRLRLRVAADRTAEIGVRFDQNDVR